jgi:Domain of unknown function (DUF4416)
MGSIRTFNPVKLFVGVLVSNENLVTEAESKLCSAFGPVDHRSPLLPFTFTDYYRKESGDTILRIFFSFEQLIAGDQLPDIKRRTNTLEETFAAASATVKRPVNLDPGYLEHAKVILASTKNFYHRMYLSHGIFGEVTMHFQNGTYEFFPWTYPDYKSPEYQKFFRELRDIYRRQLRSVCLLKNRDDIG